MIFKNRLLLILLFVSVLLVLSGCIAPEGQPPAGAQQPLDANADATPDQNVPAAPGQGAQPEPAPIGVVQGAIDECKNQPAGIKADACLVEAARNYNTVLPCGQLVSLPKDSCYSEAAAANGNSSFCTGIQNAKARENCYFAAADKSLLASDCALIDTNATRRDSCYANVAENAEDETACEHISKTVDEDACYKTLADLKSDYTVCGKISHSYTAAGYNRDSCYLEFGKTKEICSLLISEKAREECYDFAGRSGKDAEACRLIADANPKALCVDYVARQLKDVGLCTEVSDMNAALGDACFDYLAENAQTAELCQHLGTYEKRNACYNEVAVDTNSESTCASILGDAALRDSCYKTIGIAKEESSVCALISANNFTPRDGCYLSVAEAKSDTSLCELLHFAANYVECFADVAFSGGLIGVCATAQKYTFPELKYEPEQHCYKEYAAKANDSAYCEQIAHEDLKIECVAAVEG